MMARLFLVLALLIWGGAGIAQSEFPALFDVTGVAADDTLNVRQEPSGSAPVIGTFGPHRTGIEVTGQNDGGTWLRVNMHETAGWVSARFLARQTGTGDYAFARALNCFGTEPFWSLDIVQGANVTFSGQDGSVRTFAAGQIARGAGRLDRYVLGFGQGAVVLAQTMCSDGMSDRQFALEASVLIADQGLTLYTGCCSIQQD